MEKLKGGTFMEKKGQNQVAATVFICLGLFIYGISVSNASIQKSSMDNNPISQKSSVYRGIASE